MEPGHLVPAAVLGVLIGLPLPLAAAILCIRRRARRRSLVLAVFGGSLLNVGACLGVYFAMRPAPGAYQHSSMDGLSSFLVCAGLCLTQFAAFAAVLCCAWQYLRRESRAAESE